MKIQKNKIEKAWPLLKQRVAIYSACAAFAGLSIGFSPLAAAADTNNYPSKPIVLVVPNAPGGGLDLLGRIVAKKLATELNQSVVVENRSGGDGNVGMQYVARSAPDGYTILVDDLAYATNPTLYPDLPFVPLTDLAPITMGVTAANVLVVNPSVPANNMKELLAYARANPGRLNYGSGGTSTMAHLAGELFNSMAHIKMTHVPYKGGAPAMADLLGGHIQLEFSSPSTAIPQIKSGKLKALAVTTPYRIPSLPDVPTIAESGFPGYEAVNWYIFVAPAKTPRPIIDRLNKAIAAALTSPDVKSTLIAQGLEVHPGTPETLGTFLKSETLKWKKVLQAGE